MGVLLGAIADDFTGATDLCNTLVRRGMRTVQLIGVPAAEDPVARRRRGRRRAEEPHDPGRRGVDQSLAALAWLRQAGARQIFFKYCSTFDSTDAGQYRPGRRGADGRARSTDFTLVLPGLSRERPDDLSAAICSSATCCCRNRACATIR